MENNNIYCIINFFGMNLRDIFTKAYSTYTTSKKEINEFNNNFFGKCSYQLKGNDFEINIPKIKKVYKLFKQPLLFINEKDETISKVYDKDSLKEILNNYSNTYEFYINSIKKEMKEIIQNEKIPIQILLKKKQDTIQFDIFKSLNNKKELPEKEKLIQIKTNELIPYNINSLGIRRNENFTMILDKRDELIKEIKDFMNSNEIIMKIFGCDGIGKSITFIYLTSLINNFVTVYFNLKEFHNTPYLAKLELFKYQLINYFTDGIKDIDLLKNQNDINEAYNFKFNFVLNFINQLENEMKKEFDFWYFFEIFIKNIDPSKKVLFILDQYKIENDEYNKLTKIETDFIAKNNINIKLLIASSLNDMRVKIDFINYLKLYLYECPTNQSQIINTNKEDLEEEEEEVKEFFKDYLPEKKYLESDDIENNNFEKIKIFDDIEIESKDIIKQEKNIIFNEGIEQNEINNLDINDNVYKYNNKYKILYINDLISVKDINDKEKEFIEKLGVFNFNPKHHKKFKNFYKINKNNNALNDLYSSYLHNTFNNIKSKIELFYDNYNKKYKINSFSNTIIKKLMNLEKLVQEKIQLNLNSLIYYLEQFPLKYIKIIQLDKNKIIKNKHFIYLNKDSLFSSYFKIEYAFPFIKIIISRLIFEYGNSGNLSYNDISSSGIGSILEKQIRKALVIDKILNTFYLRNFWSFRRSLNKTEKKNNNKQEEENINKKEIEEEKNKELENNQNKKQDIKDTKEKINKNKEESINKNEIKNKEENEEKKEDIKIDFFNLNEVILDDCVKNPLNEFYANYYIIPHKPNNELLDSIILIPVYLNNNSEKKFHLISFQITINKKKIYSLEEYQNETINAASYIEERYGIKIIDKYFIFVLSKDYKNITTQEALISGNIPFIFFSSIEKCFYLNKTTKLNNLEQFLDKQYKILSINDINKNESIDNKNRKFLQMSLYLKKKRKREKIKITKNLFNFARLKIFDNEIPLILTEDIKNKIIQKIINNNNYKEKKIIIEYIFRANFNRIYELYKYTDLLGITFFKGFIVLINDKFDSTIDILSISDNIKKKEKEKDNVLCEIYKYINKNIKKEEENSLIISSDKKPDFALLLKYNIYKPSDIFIFSIYEIN